MFPVLPHQKKLPYPPSLPEPGLLPRPLLSPYFLSPEGQMRPLKPSSHFKASTRRLSRHKLSTPQPPYRWMTTMRVATNERG